MEAEAREVLQAAVGRRPTKAQRARAIAELQGFGAELKKRLPEGWSIADEFLAEKHLDAAWQAGQVSHDERRLWLDQLGRFEIWPEQLEALVAARMSDG
jgi:hypothetical protein